MSRSISISYVDSAGTDIPIDIPAPYFLLGTEKTSREFWSLPGLKACGIKRLTELGNRAPVTFVGWNEMLELQQELVLLEANISSIKFHTSIKAAWLSHLIYCFHLLNDSAPRESPPVFQIG